MDGPQQPDAVVKSVAGSRVLAYDAKLDLSLIELDNGPFYCIPVAPAGYKPGHLASVGYGRMAWPVTLHAATMLGSAGNNRHKRPTVSPAGRRVPGLRLEDRRRLALLQSILCFSYLVGKGVFRTNDLLHDVQLALDNPHYTLNQLRYDLSKLLGKALGIRLPATQTYIASPIHACHRGGNPRQPQKHVPIPPGRECTSQNSCLPIIASRFQAYPESSARELGWPATRHLGRQRRRGPSWP
jgi:hypothetical protein